MERVLWENGELVPLSLLGCVAWGEWALLFYLTSLKFWTWSLSLLTQSWIFPCYLLKRDVFRVTLGIIVEKQLCDVCLQEVGAGLPLCLWLYPLALLLAFGTHPSSVHLCCVFGGAHVPLSGSWACLISLGLSSIRVRTVLLLLSGILTPSFDDMDLPSAGHHIGALLGWDLYPVSLPLSNRDDTHPPSNVMILDGNKTLRI